MKLSADEIEELLSCLDVTNSDEGDARRLPRLCLSAPVLIRPLPDGTAPIPARLRDISAEGLGLLMNQPLAPGQRFVTEFSRRDGSTFTLVCQIKHCNRGADGIYSVGVLFISDQSVRKAG